MPSMRNLLTMLALLVVLACSTEAQQTIPSTGQKDPAARVGDRTVTVGELDQRWMQADPAQHAQAVQAIYDGRRNALDDLIAEMVISDAAKAKGVPVEQFVNDEVTKRAEPVTDQQIAVFYGENRGQMQGRPLEQMAPLIRRYLEDQRQAAGRTALIADLRKAGPAVRVLFDAPRQEVAVAPSDPALGPATAPVTLVEFSDFQCPFCQRVEPTMQAIKAKYGDKVRIVWKDFPLTQIHPQAFKAAEAGNCALEQGKFWQLHEKLFANQQALQPEFLKRYAADAGLDAAKFNACLDSSKYEERVRSAVAAGAKLGVGSTPTTFVNGRIVSGAQPLEVFAAVIDEELARAVSK